MIKEHEKVIRVILDERLGGSSILTLNTLLQHDLITNKELKEIDEIVAKWILEVGFDKKVLNF